MKKKFVFSPYVNELAVGVETGFVIWTLYPPTKESFPTSQFISTLSEGHAPVTAVDYSKNVIRNLILKVLLNKLTLINWFILYYRDRRS